MSNRKNIIISFVLIMAALCKPLVAQNYQQGYFRNPLGIPIILAGSFGELRANHFHTGIDIKTAGGEGLPVFAAADGYVSRIGVSGGGYGNVLYIAHPNGYSTVYGHLLKFTKPIQDFVKQAQYSSEKFEQDLLLAPEKFPVKKGELVAYSGNTGGSHGPHLHYEIRETKTENPVNPLMWGYNLTDNMPPVIRGIKIYALDSLSYVKVFYTSGRSVVAVRGQNIKLDAAPSGKKYVLRGISRIEAGGSIGMAIEGVDYINGSYNTMGLFNIELCVDEKPVYQKSMRRLDFDLKRYINTHTDYAEKKKSGRWFEKSYVSSHNTLPIYDVLENRGQVQLKPGTKYHLTYYIHDYSANTAILPFDISCPETPMDPRPLLKRDFDTLLKHDQAIAFTMPGLYFNAKPNSFYEDLELDYSSEPKKPTSKNIYSDIFEIGTDVIPVHDYFDIGIQFKNLPERLYSKACLISHSTGYLGGTVDGGWIKSQARSLGKFYVSVDTVKPEIKPINITPGRKMTGAKVIAFKISDNMAGITDWKGKIDDKYVLFQRDNKSATIWYEFDEHCPPGPHTLTLEVTDNKKNTAKYSAKFFR